MDFVTETKRKIEALKASAKRSALLVATMTAVGVPATSLMSCETMPATRVSYAKTQRYVTIDGRIVQETEKRESNLNDFTRFMQGVGRFGESTGRAADSWSRALHRRSR